MIPYGRHFIDEDDVQAVVEVLRHGALTQGPKIAEFEQAVAGYVGAKYAIAVSSGTAGLHLACLAAGVTTGDNIVTSPNTFVASANCALYVGANPHFSDIDPLTLNLDPGALGKTCAELKQVKAIIPVHFAGLPCDMPELQKIAGKHRSIIIEDAAHALGATYPGGGKVGNCAQSDMTVFSFHPVKLIAAGEGGLITTNSEGIYRKLLRLRSHGINKGNDTFLSPDDAYQDGKFNRWYYEMQEIGYNYRITDIQSALALSQFGKIDQFIKRRREEVAEYDEAFLNQERISPVQISGRKISAHHLYVVRISFDKISMSRTEFMSKLHEDGIGSQVHYIPLHFHPYYRKRGFKPGTFPNAERYYREALSLPLFYDLTPRDQERVIQKVKGLLQ